jgi:hypothetical protein
VISQTRRGKILEAIDAWGKYRLEEFTSASETLFGEATLSKRVEKGTALTKAVSILKRA